MKALHIHAGAQALAHLQRQGLQPHDIQMIPAAAGGPKGLILSHLDRDLFGRWLPQAPAEHKVHLVGASIGAWRMGAALMPDPVQAFERLAHDYIHQDYPVEPGAKAPTPTAVSEGFAQALQEFFGEHLPAMLSHPRWHLHVVTSRGMRWLQQGAPWGTRMGFAALTLGNFVSRQWVGQWLQRVVFSTGPLPLRLNDLPTSRTALTPENFTEAVRASCSIPFWLDPVCDIPGAPRGAHWDGGLVDYHFHWPYTQLQGLALYPHFQRQVIPGWLDKMVKWRHGPTAALDRLIVLAPNPAWVATLPNGKLPDRNDFTGLSTPQRHRDWQRAVAEAERLADEWREWLLLGCPAHVVQPL